MSSTTFVDYSTVIPASWLNDVNTFYYSGTGASGVTYTFNGLRLNVTSTATATAGAAVLPASPVGFIPINVNGTNYKIPYYNV
jgi:hypothetical protein